MPATGQIHSTLIALEMAINERMDTNHKRSTLGNTQPLVERALSDNAHIVLLVRSLSNWQGWRHVLKGMYRSSNTLPSTFCSCKYLRNQAYHVKYKSFPTCNIPLLTCGEPATTELAGRQLESISANFVARWMARQLTR